MAFKKATKSQAKLRLAISGPSGSGKTYTALTLGKHLGERMAVIDTERGSASKYAGDVADFDVDELTDFSVQQYTRAMNDAAREGYDVLVIDSLTHAWSGKGGILEEVDKRGGKFEAWKQASPLHARFIDAILSYPGHVIVTMRSKMDYLVSQTERNGKRETKIEKVGLAPVQRDDVSYEFDVWLEMNDAHNATVSKTRCRAIDGSIISLPGKDLADTLRAWLSDGAPMQEAARPLAGSAPHAAASGTSTPSARSIQTTSTGSETRSRGAATEPRLDEYGLTVPASPCPVFTKDGPNKGKRWDEAPGPLIEKMLEDFGDKMSAQQVEWGMYLAARRQARKAKEAAEAEAPTGDPEPPAGTEAAQ